MIRLADLLSGAPGELKVPVPISVPPMLRALIDVAEAAQRVATVHVKDDGHGDYVVAFGRMMDLRARLAKLSDLMVPNVHGDEK